MADVSTDNPTRGRWGIVAAALLLQFAIGAVYAWSIFSKAFVANFKAKHGFALSKTDAAIPFETTIGMIFIGTYIGGRIQDRKGPRVVALTGGIIYGIGIVLASFATASVSYTHLTLPTT